MCVAVLFHQVSGFIQLINIKANIALQDESTVRHSCQEQNGFDITRRNPPPGADRATLGMVGPTYIGPTPVAVPEMNWKEGYETTSTGKERTKVQGSRRGLIQE